MTRIVSVAATLLVLAAFPATAKNYEKLLKGDYAFAGEATCLVSINGFNANQTPVGTPAPFPRISSYSAHGVRTFNGDGTGRTRIRVVSIAHPFAVPLDPPPHFYSRGSASSLDFENTFTYTVSPQLEVTVTSGGVLGTFLSGPRLGQTVTFEGFPDQKGYLSQNLRMLTLAHEVPGVERHIYSNGDADFRICHRSRVLLERKDRGGDDD